MRDRIVLLIVAAETALWMAAAGVPAHAARPFVTDDARIVDADSCQLEAWRRANRSGLELWALPACNFTGNLEFTLGGNRITDDRGFQRRDIIVQGKSLFARLEKNGYGVGVVGGVVMHDRYRDGSDRLASWCAYVPASFSFFDDRVVMHLNVGAVGSRDEDRTVLTGGLGAGIALGERLFAIVETYGNHRDEPSIQTGLRYWVVPGRVQVDATYGEQNRNHSSDGRWWSIGLRVLTEPILRR